MFKAAIISILLLTTYSGHSSEALEQKQLKSNSDFDVDQYLSQNISLEDFILYQIYQETKCYYWHETVSLPLTCMSKFPIKSKNSYKLVFQTGFNDYTKKKQQSFNELNDEKKNWYIKNQTEMLKSSLDTLLLHIFIPVNDYKKTSIDYIRSKIINNLKIEVHFYYGEEKYISEYSSNKLIEIKKIISGIKAL
ncbi:MAG: hypothetical protein R3E90_15375 [Marinicella sp.]